MQVLVTRRVGKSMPHVSEEARFLGSFSLRPASGDGVSEMQRDSAIGHT